MKRNIPWELIISRLRGNLGAEDAILLNTWLEREDNYQLLIEIEIIWNNVQKKSATYEPDVEYYWKQLSARIQKDMPPVRKPMKLSLKYFYRIAAVASIVIVAFLGIFSLQKEISLQPEYTTYSTKESKTTVLLPDSSEVILRENTILTYQSNEELNERVVNIIGEAYFKVKHDAQKPFLVNTNGVTIKVHGTEFNVSSYISANKVLVSLIEGSVSMRAKGKDTFLKPGEEGTYDKYDKSISIAEEDVNLSKVWASDKVRFEDKSLHEVCKYLSKWYGVNIKIDPNIIENQSYTFTVIDQPLTEIIEIMSKINSFDYQFIKDNELVLKQKNK